MRNQLIVDTMNRWHFIILIIITILISLAVAGVSIYYHQVVLTTEITPLVVDVSSYSNGTYALMQSLDVQKYDKWLEVYLKLEPKTEINEEISFYAETQLHIVKNFHDTVNSFNRTYTTRCFIDKCDDIIFVSDDAVQEAKYIILVAIKDIENKFNSTGLTISLMVSKAFKSHTIFSLSLTITLVCISTITFIILFVIAIKKKEFNIYVSFNLLLSFGMILFNDPFVALGFYANYISIEYVDNVLMELYMFILFVWIFFHVDHLKLLAIEEPYPILQWVLRSCVLIAYFFCFILYFFMNILHHSSSIAGSPNPIMDDIKAIRDLLQVVLVFWILMSEFFSFTQVMNPINRKRLFFLTPFTLLVAIACVIQLFFQNDSHNNLPIPVCMMKLMNTYFVIVMCFCFYQIKNDLATISLLHTTKINQTILYDEYDMFDSEDDKPIL
ncbi:hypothetical protein EDI_037450 [Entamoeba dispar SAW760]|uniref:Wntless-like transmembrane domain-containing protein n=1 Tax=Entamoeba dispar (strain ATCC PRA-260 / SAW760) TaxID=370354 RepID=B0EAT1_ENTDS|nr:uncharacterized protein EDI_037450 [Entamoeba dispar SAW760]EDR28370.1 hypothetical protein EDI_037450 [Entamoeba dispar SAW760]|eukprot:EDR28370.1 hypothetical protein EDI_037450 [Entamoeba dispar SAW760]